MAVLTDTWINGKNRSMSETGKHSYGQILKSSALIGGSSIVNIGLGMVRTKAIALILGGAGVGLFGLYGYVNDLTRSIAGMGVNSSGVRQIAEAAGTGDAQRLARTATTLRRVAFCSGTIGALLLLALSKPISWLTFKDYRHTGSVALLALAVFFADVSQGQAALVQGMRRISDLARMSVLGAFYGTLFSIPIIYFFHEKGVAPSLVCVAAAGILSSWWYARRIKVERVALTMRQAVEETSALLKLGVVFMTTGLMPLGAGYLVSIMVLRKFDLAAAGCYQAASVLGGTYVGFVTQAMGADFYPRLTAVARDHKECNRLVNEQAEVGLLLAGPGVIATLTFAPLVIWIFYSSNFAPAVEILRWICLGMMLRVASWPMAFILVAKGERKLYFWTELLANGLFVFLVWAGLEVFGLKGSGIAFFGLYAAYCSGIYLVVRRLSGFGWSGANLRLAAIFVPGIAAVFVGWYFLSPVVTAIFGVTLTLLTGIYSLKTLCALVPLERLPRAAQRIVVLFRLAPSNTGV
jgi:PST family polysaccharide transporter